MKKLSEMKLATKALLNEAEQAITGERPVGNGTDYYGPSNPSSISTYVDGMPWGEDGSSGSMFGDSWSLSMSPGEPIEGFGKMMVMRREG